MKFVLLAVVLVVFACAEAAKGNGGRPDFTDGPPGLEKPPNLNKKASEDYEKYKKKFDNGKINLPKGKKGGDIDIPAKCRHPKIGCSMLLCKELVCPGKCTNYLVNPNDPDCPKCLVAKYEVDGKDMTSKCKRKFKNF